MVSVEVVEVVDSPSISSYVFQAQEVAVGLVEVVLHSVLTVVEAAEAAPALISQEVPVRICREEPKQIQADWISSAGRISMVEFPEVGNLDTAFPDRFPFKFIGQCMRIRSFQVH